MNVRIIDSIVRFIRRPFDKPLRLSAGVIDGVDEAMATVRVRVGAHEAVGRGSILLSDLWAWPGEPAKRTDRAAAMRMMCERIAEGMVEWAGPAAHPLEMGLRLHQAVESLDLDLPALARAVCVSPFDAALHDAVGHALGISSFDLLENDAPVPTADALFGGVAAALPAIRSALRPPVSSLNAWMVLNADDDLAAVMPPWVSDRSYTHFKLKLLGRDPAADAVRIAAVYDAARSLGVASPRLSLDSNEGNASAQSVADCLARLMADHPAALEAVDYLEQPTPRATELPPQAWADSVRPVLIDEGLSGLHALPAVVREGWAGLCLKTCKGHSAALVAAAFARQHGLRITVQDLTNVGYAMVHSALLASRLDTIDGIELNALQFLPATVKQWADRCPGLLRPTNGRHHLPAVPPVGLGSTWLCPDFEEYA